MGEAYSENEAHKFHVDSVPAVLTELIQIINCKLSKKGKEPSDASQEAILDDIARYIEESVKGGFINNDTILFHIEDVQALVNRYC